MCSNLPKANEEPLLIIAPESLGKLGKVFETLIFTGLEHLLIVQTHECRTTKVTREFW